MATIKKCFFYTVALKSIVTKNNLKNRIPETLGNTSFNVIVGQNN